MIAREQRAATNAQNDDACIFAIARISNDIAVAALYFEHDRRFLHLFEVTQRIAHLSGAFKIEPLGGIQHALAHAAYHIARPAIEEPDNFVNHDAVVCTRLIPDARRLTTLDEIVQTRALRGFTRQPVVARAYREDPLHHVQRFSHRTDIGVRSEIARTVVDHSPRDQHTRKGLLHRDLDVRIRLVVAQRDVEPRPILLDQRRLENQRMRFGRHDNRFEIMHFAQQSTRLGTGFVILCPVAAYARPQLLRLADVQDGPIRVFPEIHPRSSRQMREFDRDSRRHATMHRADGPLVIGDGQRSVGVAND